MNKFILPPKKINKISPALLPYFDKVRGNIIPGAYRLQKLVSKWLCHNILHFPSILVTGSNGKGTTCAYLERILREHNLKTGLYTSPHLVHPNERIRLNGVPVSESILEDSLNEINEQSAIYLPDATFFEIMTATALLIFLKEKIDFLICEVGLGGHFDSTNAISPLVSIITSISLEHTQYLGDSLKKIAADKSHISRRSRPLVIGPLNEEALAGVQETAEKTGCNIVESQKDAVILQNEGEPCSIGCQQMNLNTALTALKQLSAVTGMVFEKEKINSAVKNTFWPGRFDIRKINSRTIIFDASHNPAGFDFFTEQYLNSSFAKSKCVLLFASLSDKDWKSTLKKIPLIATHIIFTQTNSERSVPVDNFLNSIHDIKRQKYPFPDFETIFDFDTALEKSINFSPELPLVITGSIAFIGSVMERLDFEVFCN